MGAHRTFECGHDFARMFGNLRVGEGGFAALESDAHPDLLILKQAKAEYAKLQ